MLNSSVLVLNRSYLPVHVTSVGRAFSLIYRRAARAVNDRYETFDFEEWSQIVVPRDGAAIGTVRGRIQVPRVIVLMAFDRMPRRHVRYSRVNVFARDKYTCQYCGVRAPRGQLNLDHVIPRALGGKTSWENVVCSCVACNRKKGGRTPSQAKLKLQRSPRRPRWTPLMTLISASIRYKEWRPFLVYVRSAGFAENREAG